MLMASIKKVIAAAGNLLDRAAHGQPGRFQDVPAIDFECVRGPHGPGSGALADAPGEDLAAFRLQTLAVVQAADGTLRIEHDCRREDGTEQRAPAGLIDPGNGTEAGLAEGSLMAAGGHGEKAATHGRFIRVRADVRLCPSDPADSRAWRGALVLCARHRYDPPPERAAEKCAPRPGRN